MMKSPIVRAVSGSLLLTASLLAPLHAQAPQPAPAAPAPAGQPAPVWSLAFSPDGKMLAAGSYQRVQLWDVAAQAPLRQLAGHAGPVRTLTWSADGKRLAAGGGKPGRFGEVRVWDTANPAAQPVTLKEHKDVVESVAFCGESAVVSAGVDEKALVTDLRTGRPVKALADHTNRVVAVAASPSGEYVATGSLDRTVKIWSGADYAPLANLDNNNGQVYALAFLPSGDQLVAAGEDGNVRVYRLSKSRTGKVVGVNGQVARTIGGNRTPIFTVAAAAKGDLLAYGGQDRTVNVVNAQNGGRKYTLKECPDAVYSLAFSPDGALLAAGCRDGSVRLWNMADGKLVTELPRVAAKP